MKVSHSIIVLLFAVVVVPVNSSAFTCKVTTTPVSFGVYDSFASTPTDGTGSVKVDCNNKIAGNNKKDMATVSVTISQGGAGSFNPRQMIHESGQGVMNYNLYTDRGQSVIWGDGTSGGSSRYVGEFHKDMPESDKSLTIYGRIPARQNVRAGMYSDTLMVTLEW